MLKKSVIRKILDIELKIVYSKRRTLGISVLPDSSVIVRVPNRTADSTIERIVREKASWIIKHRDNYIIQKNKRPERKYADGWNHLFRGNESVLKVTASNLSFIRFSNGIIEMGVRDPDNEESIRKLLYMGYKKEAVTLFQEMFANALSRYRERNFRPTGLIIRSMKRRWGSCSGNGVITLSTGLIKLPDIYTEYVIVHELCHLKHHNHGNGYYKLLTELFPEWKKIRKEMKKFTG